jgi:hypothetical protein
MCNKAISVSQTCACFCNENEQKQKTEYGLLQNYVVQTVLVDFPPLQYKVNK